MRCFRCIVVVLILKLLSSTAIEFKDLPQGLVNVILNKASDNSYNISLCDIKNSTKEPLKSSIIPDEVDMRSEDYEKLEKVYTSTHYQEYNENKYNITRENNVERHVKSSVTQPNLLPSTKKLDADDLNLKENVTKTVINGEDKDKIIKPKAYTSSKEQLSNYMDSFLNDSSKLVDLTSEEYNYIKFKFNNIMKENSDEKGSTEIYQTPKFNVENVFDPTMDRIENKTDYNDLKVTKLDVTTAESTQMYDKAHDIDLKSTGNETRRSYGGLKLKPLHYLHKQKQNLKRSRIIKPKNYYEIPSTKQQQYVKPTSNEQMHHVPMKYHKNIVKQKLLTPKFLKVEHDKGKIKYSVVDHNEASKFQNQHGHVIVHKDIINKEMIENPGQLRQINKFLNQIQTMKPKYGQPELILQYFDGSGRKYIQRNQVNNVKRSYDVAANYFTVANQRLNRILKNKKNNL